MTTTETTETTETETAANIVVTEQIMRIISGFDSNGLATVIIPVESQTVALRFYENAELNPEIGVVLIVPSNASADTYSRHFILLAENAPLPANFKKYIATFPFGPTKQIMHVIEITL